MQVLAVVAVGDVQHVLVAVGLRLEVAIVLIDQQLKIVTQCIFRLGLVAICYPYLEVIKVSAVNYLPIRQIIKLRFIYFVPIIFQSYDLVTLSAKLTN